MGTSLVLLQVSCPLAPSHGLRLSLQERLQSLEEPQPSRGLTQALPHLPLDLQSCLSLGTDHGATGSQTVFGTPKEASHWEEGQITVPAQTSWHTPKRTVAAQFVHSWPSVYLQFYQELTLVESFSSILVPQSCRGGLGKALHPRSLLFK